MMTSALSTKELITLVGTLDEPTELEQSLTDKLIESEDNIVKISELLTQITEITDL